MVEQDYYDLLGVQRGADDAAIKAAYRRLAKEHHPDRHNGCSDKEAQFKAINEAYDILKDPQKRAAYDRFGRAAFQNGGGGQDPFGDAGFNGFSDIFSTIFGEFMDPRAQQNAARGADLLVVEATLATTKHDDPRRGHLTPEEAIDMASHAGVPRTVLVHFRAELRDRVDAACARRAGALPGRPGLVVEVGPAPEVAPAGDGMPAAGTPADGNGADGSKGARAIEGIAPAG